MDVATAAVCQAACQCSDRTLCSLGTRNLFSRPVPERWVILDAPGLISNVIFGNLTFEKATGCKGRSIQGSQDALVVALKIFKCGRRWDWGAEIQARFCQLHRRMLHCWGLHCRILFKNWLGMCIGPTRNAILLLELPWIQRCIIAQANKHVENTRGRITGTYRMPSDTRERLGLAVCATIGSEKRREVHFIYNNGQSCIHTSTGRPELASNWNTSQQRGLHCCRNCGSGIAIRA